jgi:dTDP-4-amino-4,6-dideoxygalactose transaminase
MSAPIPFEHPVHIARPLLPPLEVYIESLRGIWESRQLTNKGQLHDTLEEALRGRLRVPHLSLVCNGTMALLLAGRALDFSGEVITTPFTFAATPNALSWCGATPIFADIDPITMTLDPAAVERAITPRTTALLPVHVFGIACDVEGLQKIADRHGLRVLYDGAHAFGTEIDGGPILNFGDATILSFHATKTFHTAEGGAIVANNSALKQRIDLLRNFGIENEDSVVLPGINGKLNELQAALGLANLELIGAELRAQTDLANIYALRLKDVAGLTFATTLHPGADHQYFVVRIDRDRARISRDGLHAGLKGFNVFTRRYFHQLCSEFPFFRHLPSCRAENLPVAHRVAGEVLCLPLYGALGVAGVHRICDMIQFIATR